jgi:hypothetical protein
MNIKNIKEKIREHGTQEWAKAGVHAGKAAGRLYVVSEGISILSGLLEALHYESKHVQKGLGLNENGMGFKLFHHVRYLGLLASPLHAWSFTHHSYKTVKRLCHGEFNPAIKSAVKMVENLGSLACNAALGIEFIGEFTKLSVPVVNLTTSLWAIGTVFSLATIALQTKSLVELYFFEKSFDGKSPEEALKIIQNSDPKNLKKLKKFFGVNPKDLASRKINPLRAAEAMEALKTRLVWKKVAITLTIVAASVAIVAGVVLLASPGSSIAYLLLAGSSMIFLTAIVVNRLSVMRLQHSMKNEQIWGPKIKTAPRDEQDRDNTGTETRSLKRRKTKKALATVTVVPNERSDSPTKSQVSETQSSQGVLRTEDKSFQGDLQSEPLQDLCPLLQPESIHTE